MSGGSFSYAYHGVEGFSEQLTEHLEVYGADHYSADVLQTMRKALNDIELAAKQMKAIEWLVSCDTGEDTFLREMMDIELERLVK